MRLYWLAIFTLVALLGLGILQWQWLEAAVSLEQTEFDRQVERAMWQIDRNARNDRVMRFGILSLQRYHLRGERPPDTLQQAVWAKLDTMAAAVLERNGVGLPYHIEVLTGKVTASLMPSIASALPGQSATRDYIREMRGDIQRACDCQLYLQLKFGGLSLPFLFRRLWALWVPALVFYLLLALGFALLWRGIRREQKLSQTKNDFINHLTHEMKTPVFSISLLSKLLRQRLQSGQTEAATGYLDRIEAETGQLKGQVEQILELASLEQPDYQLQLQRIDLGALLNEVARVFRQRSSDTAGTLRFEPPANPIHTQADPEHLTNALQNLLDNAVKYGGHPPQVRLGMAERTHEVVITVADNGPGIPAAEQERVFEKFYRLNQGQAPKVGGFGLGLSYSRQIALLHGGSLRVAASGEAGTTFELRLPK
ncbi:MAG TPA: HAMP domain-containing sensor histidine kinase [Phaeodactylibacter sp.]|nr:HAMP domain-containing sensor histidine kinase [Phaeodactylibacter sp.]